MTSEHKQVARASTLAARRAMSRGERANASARVVARLLGLPELHRPETVLLYAAADDEVDLDAGTEQLRARGIRTVFPRVVGDRLELVEVTDASTLRVGYRGIREPTGTVADPADVEVAVVPGVAFDVGGGRLGQGGGHYDRLLATLPEATLRIGVCFACQVVPEVPRQPHDVPVDVVVTEHTTSWTAARR